MVGIVSGINEPTRPPNQQSSMDRFDGKPTYQCMVKGCKNEKDPRSTQHLCRPCYDVITTADTDRYYADHKGDTWMSHIIKWNNYLQESDNLSYELEDGCKKLASKIKALELEIKEAYVLEDNTTLSLNDLRKFYHENKDLKEGHKRKDEYIDSLRKEIEALNYNMDHAHEDGDKYLTVDDLCIFYTENKNVYDLAERQRNHMVLLELQLKKANETIKHQDETIQAFKKELDSMESKLSKGETFATNTKDQFAERAKINEEKQNVKFVGYTEGFWKGFEFGWAKCEWAMNAWKKDLDI